MRRTAKWLVVGLGVSVAPLSAQENTPAGPPIIDSVAVITRNVFDRSEASRNFLFRLANLLHVPTRPYVVRQELQFHPGEPYDSAKVAESERLLRARGLFRDVEIDTVRTTRGLVAQVVTADGWTTELILNAKSTGDEVSWAIGAQERNLFGTGALAGVTYRDEPDRTAIRLRGELRRIRGTRLMASGFYDDLSDGHVGSWFTGVPFFANSDRVGFTLQGWSGLQRVLQFRDGDSSETYRRRSFVQRVRAGVAPRASTGGYLRLGVGGQVRREEYVRWDAFTPGIADTVTGAVGVLVDLLDARFMVVTHYNGFSRDEDIDLSTRLGFETWLAPTAFGYRETGIAPAASFQTGVALGRNFVRFQAAASGLFTSGGLDSGQVRLAVTAAARVLPKQATVLHVEYGARRGTPPGFEFDLGHGTGPRGFGPHAFTGDRMAWGSLEHRAFVVDEVMGLLGLGFTTFADLGGSWYANEPARVGGDVGIGLRFGATRATGQNVGALDLAYLFGDGSEDGHWVVTFGRGFAF